MQLFQFSRPRGYGRFTAAVASPEMGTLTLAGKTDRFDLVLSRGDETIMRYREGDCEVEMGGRPVPIFFPPWREGAWEIVINGARYTHAFKKLRLLRYELHSAVVCEGSEIADLYYTIHSQILVFHTGGPLRMELKPGIPFLPPLFYTIAFWWWGCFVDETTT